MPFLRDHEKFNVYQGSKRKKCPWIRIYRSIIQDVAWHELNPIDAKALIGIFMIANPETGELPEKNKAAFMLRMSLPEYEQTLSNLHSWLVINETTDAEISA